MSAEHARQEILRPREILEDKLACRISSFAYPFGYYSQAVRQIVRECGYSSACVVRYALSSTSDDPFALARLIVTRNMDIGRFARLLEGCWMPDTIVQRARATLWRLVRHAGYLGRGWAAAPSGPVSDRELGERKESATKGY
jgi:peptidoglycan/xylan/chitin deacetylase (PgdA/CDA1 family)